MERERDRDIILLFSQLAIFLCLEIFLIISGQINFFKNNIHNKLLKCLTESLESIAQVYYF